MSLVTRNVTDQLDSLDAARIMSHDQGNSDREVGPLDGTQWVCFLLRQSWPDSHDSSVSVCKVIESCQASDLAAKLMHLQSSKSNLSKNETSMQSRSRLLWTKARYTSRGVSERRRPSAGTFTSQYPLVLRPALSETDSFCHEATWTCVNVYRQSKRAP